MAIYNISRIKKINALFNNFDSPFTVNNTMKMQLLKNCKEKSLKLRKLRQCTVFLNIGSSAKV